MTFRPLFFRDSTLLTNERILGIPHSRTTTALKPRNFDRYRPAQPMDEHPQTADQRRIIIIDDSESIHRDYEKVLNKVEISESEKTLSQLESLMFDDEPATSNPADTQIHFELDHALQGEQGYEMILKAREEGRPYSVAFVDMRMPPGWDGMQTIEKFWDKDPDIQIVICSAYADYSFHQIIERVGHSDRLLILKKPFDQSEVYQMAGALSEKWRAERSTRELLAGLEEKVKTRTTDLSAANGKLHELNTKLETVAEEAQCAARSKGRFLATMSHEIRTTLNGIMGASQMLNDTQLQPVQSEFANIIQSSGEALMTIINDILDYSKYENGQLQLESIPFSLRDLVKSCASLMESVIEAHNVNLDFQWDDAIPTLLNGDSARLRQIFLNLLNNAIKFGKNGKVTFACSLVKTTGYKATLRISVRDEGVGMTEETVSRLFSAFMQADSSTTREYGGTGLGLAICKLLADAMETKIQVESEHGKGSCFSITIELPISDINTGNPLLPKETTNDKRANHSGKRVLLVDDHAINRKLGTHFLKSFGIETETANDGIEAVDKIAAGNFDLVLMDLQMPNMGGIEATQVIRAANETGNESLKEIPIIALTANAFSDVEERCLASGMNAFLTKPLKKTDLLGVLNIWMPNIASE